MEQSDMGMQQGLGNLGLGFLLGAIVGVAIGMLYAPRAGADTRAMVVEKADVITEKVNQAVDLVKEKTSAVRRRAARQE